MTEVYSVQYLNKKSDVQAFVALQQEVVSRLPEGKKHFLKPRTEEDLLAHLDDGMAVLGVKDAGGKLLAAGLLSYPSRDAVINLDDYPIDNKHTTAVVQSLMCHPDHRKNGYADQIVSASVALAEQRGLSCVMAKVAQNNSSQGIFLDQAFNRAAWALEQGKKHAVWYMKHDIHTDAVKVHPEAAFETSLKPGDIVVIKFGGAMVSDDVVIRNILQQALTLKEAGYQPILVTGGGSQISKALEEAGINHEFVNGERPSCAETMKVMSPLMDELAAELGRKMTQEARAMCLDIMPVAMGGYEGVLSAKKSEMPGMMEHNGEITNVDKGALLSLMAMGIPIIHPVCAGPNGEHMNVNADKVALEIGKAMGAEKLIYVSDIDGVKDKHGNVITVLKAGDEEALIADKTIKGGMIPKITSAVEAVREGTIGSATILNGAKPYSILQELYTKGGSGTQIVPALQGPVLGPKAMALAL